MLLNRDGSGPVSIKSILCLDLGGLMQSCSDSGKNMHFSTLPSSNQIVSDRK